MASVEQLEELEVLKSIFDGDTNFTVVSDNVIQYKFGEDGHCSSFLLEIQWPSDYPTSSLPNFNLDSFYNRHLDHEVKHSILMALSQEGESLRGAPMTFSVLDYLKENCKALVANQRSPQSQLVPDSNSNNARSTEEVSVVPDQDCVNAQSQKNLTKSQKRRMWDRGAGHGEYQRGSNWVDIIKHLSQTGTAE